MAEPWSAQEAGAGLLAAVTRAISEEQARARTAGRLLRNSDLARAVLASPALQDANQKMLDAMLSEYEPKVAQMVAAEAAPLIAAAVEPFRAALKAHMQSFTDPKSGGELCGGCLMPSPCPDTALVEGS